MKQLTRLQDIESCRLPPPLRTLAEHILVVELSIAKSSRLDPDDGAVYLLEDGDTDQTLIEVFERPFSAIPFENIQRIPSADAFVCILLRDNECAITLILPDREWLPIEWRETINHYLKEVPK